MSVESPIPAESSENSQNHAASAASESSTADSIGNTPDARSHERPRAGKIWFFVLLRLLFFLVPLAILWILTGEPWFSAIAAALIGFALSLLLLQRQRDPLLQVVYQRTSGQVPAVIHGEDEEVEDEIVDQAFNDSDAASEDSGSQRTES